MPAHLYPTRRFNLFACLALLSLPLLGPGCSSSDSTEYRQFSETIDDRDQKTDNESTATTAGKSTEQTQTDKPATVTASTPAETGSKPEVQQTAADKQKSADALKPGSTPPADSSPEAETELPLVAKKPDAKDRALSEAEQKELASMKPREVKILVKDRSFRRTSPEDALLINYDDIDLLKVMNMEPVTPEAPELMPQWLKDLDGKRIRIRGFMYPPYQQTGNEYFQLARDNQICCFGKNPKIYDLFPVVMRDGETTDYILNRPFDVVGVFHIKAETLDDELHRIYMIDDAIVIDK